MAVDNRSNAAVGLPTEEKQFEEEVLHIDRVARVVKGGRRFRFRALVVTGDGKGRVGVGSAKGADVTGAITKAGEVARKNMVSLSLYKETIPHEVQAGVGGANILIKPASPGTGLIAGGVVRTILEVGGIKNALSKSLGSSNKTNIAYATMKALESMVPASKWVTKQQTTKSAPAKKASSAQTSKEVSADKAKKAATKKDK